MPKPVLANLVVAALLAGLIWTIQVVHYPLFDGVPPSAFPAYEARHQDRITIIVLPLMLANIGLAAWLLRGASGDGLTRGNAALALGVFVVTGLVFAPIHGQLHDGWDADAHSRLVALNWIRVAAWSAQVAVAWRLVDHAWARR
jgi:hypothetical protein